MAIQSVTRVFYITLLILPLLHSCTNGETELEDSEEIKQPIELKYQEFKIDPNTNSKITGTSGTIIEFTAGCFEVPSNQDSLTLLLYEAYTPAQFLLGNITTTTNQGDILSTNGAIQIVALRGRDTVELKPDSALRVGFKRISKWDNPPLLFFGSRIDGKVVWNDRHAKSTESDTPSDSIEVEGVLVNRADHQNYGLMEYYLYEVNDLGWLNSDLYPTDTVPKCDLRLTANLLLKASDWLIFPSQHGACSAYWKNGQKSFFHVPINAEVVYVSFYTDDSLLYFHSSKHLVQPDVEFLPVYHRLTGRDALADSINRLGWQAL